jgi:argininosuccinate lyase
VPHSYAKDLQDDKKFIFESLDLVMSSIDLFHEVLCSIKFNTGAMSEAFEGGILATDLADVLVNRGIPFRDAHEEVARLVKTSTEKKISLKNLNDADIATISPNITPEDLSSVSLEQSVERKASIGGTGATSIKEQIAKIRSKS